MVFNGNSAANNCYCSHSAVNFSRIHVCVQYMTVRFYWFFLVALDFRILGKQKNRTRNPDQEKLSAAGEARLKSLLQYEYEFYSFIKQRFAKLKHQT